MRKRAFANSLRFQCCVSASLPLPPSSPILSLTLSQTEAWRHTMEVILAGTANSALLFYCVFIVKIISCFPPTCTVSRKAAQLAGRGAASHCICRALAPASGRTGEPGCRSPTAAGLGPSVPRPRVRPRPSAPASRGSVTGRRCGVAREGGRGDRRKKRKGQTNAGVSPKDLRRDHLLEILLPC